MARRAVSPRVLEAPDRASPAIIARCRTEIEGRLKAVIRRGLIPLFRFVNGLAEVGEGFHGPRSGRILVGPGSRVGRYAFIGHSFQSHGPIVVGDLCMISTQCTIIGNDHVYDIPGTPARIGVPDTPRAVTVFELDVWVGARALIREGVRLGRGSIVGAGALVTRDVPPYAIVTGIPARVVGYRFDEEQIAAHEAIVCEKPRT